MRRLEGSRRDFLRTAGVAVGASLVLPKLAPSRSGAPPQTQADSAPAQVPGKPDYMLRIRTCPIEIAPNRIVSVTNYNGQFPSPLLRLKEGQRVTVDIYNDTDSPEQLHWHGQKVPADVGGASEQGTPFIPAHGKRRIEFIPQPAGFRFYHTHNRAGANLSAGQYSGQVGPVYIEPRSDPGKYDREVFLVLKEFEPTFSRGGDMAMHFLSPAITVKALKRPVSRP
ncbi:MAG TPA: multicopper oxidase domain-containing protein [Terriglobales bacterium]|nr:multicopper oxidase domain-containing protein [Terriglobales bacterium]